MTFDPRRVLLSLSTAGAMLIAGPSAGYAQGSTIVAPGSQTAVYQDGSDNEAVSDEVAFIRTAVSDAATEIEAGELARDRAGNSEVRAFAERLIREHRDLMDDAVEVADGNGVSANQSPTDDDERALIDDLSTLTGQQFDETYLRAFVQDQRVTLQDYLAARDIMDDDVSTYAHKQIGKLSDQLRAAIELARRLDIDVEESLPAS